MYRNFDIKETKTNLVEENLIKTKHNLTKRTEQPLIVQHDSNIFTNYSFTFICFVIVIVLSILACIAAYLNLFLINLRPPINDRYRLSDNGKAVMHPLDEIIPF